MASDQGVIKLDQLVASDRLSDEEVAELAALFSRANFAMSTGESAGGGRGGVADVMLFTVQFANAHGVDLAVGVASEALWEGLRFAVRRLFPKRDGTLARTAQVDVRIGAADARPVAGASAEELEARLREVLEELHEVGNQSPP